MYNHGQIDKKWQDRWLENGVFKAEDFSDKPKQYILVEFPYPSGAGLHVGHPRSYTALDVIARKARMHGKNVLYPMGWDAFGLPTENYAIKTGRAPQEVTAENVATFKRQIQSLGLSFDWSREINSTDPGYYKWTQWQFLQFYNAGLAYKAKMPINWCPKCKIGLANEEAQGGVCERCGGPVEKRDKEQWMIGITKYAERLLSDLDQVNYLPKIRKQQEEWIGKSEGAQVEFKIDGADHVLRVFTTRPDTLFGVTYVTLAPEHELVKEITTDDQRAAVEAYVGQVARKTEIERTDATKEKTGVFTGAYAINPVNGARVPVWISDYVLAGYGTGAVMAVPAHDERDFEFAQTFGLPIRKVVVPPQLGSIAFGNAVTKGATDIRVEAECWTEDGININSDFLDGLTTAEAKTKITEWLSAQGVGARNVTYKLRDWVFSRQRYWGEPIPLVHCGACAAKKQKVLYVHGFNSSGAKNEPMRAQLEAMGFEVLMPEMSTKAEPDFDAWMSELAPYFQQLSEDDIVMGHSLGGHAAVSALVRAGKKVKALLLMAPAIGEFPAGYWESRKKEKPEGAVAMDKLQQFLAHPLDLERASALATSKEVVWSDDDPRVPEPTHAIYPASWYINRVTGHRHFWGVSGVSFFVETIAKYKNTGWVPLPESQLPLTLPAVEKYEPTDNGESPLAAIADWVTTTCPHCGGPARRETDTMPNWAGSSWYFLRYIDAHNDQAFAAGDKLKYWMPVDLYNGGMEHTTLHLLYSRFWNKFMYDCGWVPTAEPYARRVSHGLIMAEDGQKMSKSKGNVVNPDEIVQEQGADTLRVYELFIGPFSEPAPWSTSGVAGVRRFLDRVMRLPGLIKEAESDAVTRGLHKAIKKVGDDIERMSFNTAVAELMTFVNTAYAGAAITKGSLMTFLTTLNVFAPHVAEELWEQLGGRGFVCQQPWPAYDEALTHDETFELVIQVNGKVRDRLQVAAGTSDEELKALALASARVVEQLGGKEPQKVFVVKNKLVNIVV